MAIQKQFDQWGPIDGRPLYSSFWFVFAMQEMKNRWGIFWPTLEGVFTEGKMTFFWNTLDIQRMGKKVIEKYLISAGNLRSLKREYDNSVKSLKSVAVKIEKLRTDVDFKIVSALAAEWFKAFNNFWLIAAVPEIANYGIPAHLEKLLEPYIKDSEKRADALRILLAPEFVSFHQKSELGLLQLFVNNNPKDLRRKLETYATNWYWVENSYYENKRLNANYFQNQLRGISRAEALKKLEKIKNYHREAKREKQNTIKINRLPNRIRVIASLLSYSIWWQDHRKSVIWWANGVIDRLSSRAGKEFGLSHDQIMYYLYDEWLRLLTDKKVLPAKVLKQREKKFAVIIKLSGYKTYAGKRTDAMIKKYAQSQTQATETIKGLTVSRGPMVRGRAHILPSTRDISQFEKGEILIAPMTSPDYVPVMRKAAAVVTDVGGLMSHAAVVSRELGIPCIVGTKVATKIFKTGDLVEVDTDKGIVKKI